MKERIIALLKNLFPRWIFELRRGYNRLVVQNPHLLKSDIIKKGRIIFSNSKRNYMDDYVRQFQRITEKISIKSCFGYIYPYDSLLYRGYERQLICSITVDFGKVLESDLHDLSKTLHNCNNTQFKNNELSIIDSIQKLANRIASLPTEKDAERIDELKAILPDLLYRKPVHLDEALQKLLFYNALFWQMGHFHIGLGRLDLILIEYYNKDIKTGALSKNEAKILLRNFIRVLGDDTPAKSVALRGDTGQYILLGGMDKDGNNIDNELTEIFIEVLTELKIPDPKLILRVNERTDESIWEKSIKCIMTGIGSPLIMNEKIVIDKMIRFGYNSSDVWNVGTSACWEPLVIGKSFDQNNPFRSAVAILPLNRVITSNSDYTSFKELYTAFKEEYKKELKSVVRDIEFDCSPLFSLFFDECINREEDFTTGGAVYSNHGAQVVGLPNVVNALLNIKRLVYEENLFKLSDCRQAIKDNFEGMEDFRNILVNGEKKFGSTDVEVVKLTNDLIKYTGDVVSELSSNGRPVKVGFSSPNYISESLTVQASLDGRKKGDPFAVHISPLSSKIDISEILDFSASLIYGDNCINGNVVDFILPSSYTKQHYKLIGILQNAITKGIFELQLNVLDKETLLDAKFHPEKYPDLIVRVWGFSAYFNDLPEEYKDNLIRRAEIYEAT